MYLILYVHDYYFKTPNDISQNSIKDELTNYEIKNINR